MAATYLFLDLLIDFDRRIKSSKNFPRNHAVPGLIFKNCFGDEVDIDKHLRNM